MKFIAGGRYGIEKKDIEGDSIRVLTEDGKEMFEIFLGQDGHSIEVRGVGTCKVGDKIYTERLMVKPVACNVLSILPMVYEG